MSHNFVKQFFPKIATKQKLQKVKILDSWMAKITTKFLRSIFFDFVFFSARRNINSSGATISLEQDLTRLELTKNRLEIRQKHLQNVIRQ